MARFNTSIPTKKTSTELFSEAEQESESTRAYLRRFNVEMLKVEELIEPIVSEALIKGVKEHVLWRELYVLPYRSLFEVNQIMENHIQIEGANLLRHVCSCFYKDNQHQWFSKWNNHGTRRAFLIPVTQITLRCIILYKNVSFLNMNDLFKMAFHFL